MNRKDYESYYKKLDLLKIVKILEDAKTYNNIAIEVAKEELKNREVSEEDYEKIKLNLNRQITESNTNSIKLNTFKNKAKNEFRSKVDETIQTVNPLTKNSSNTSIKIVASYFILSGIITLINHIDILIFIYQQEDLEFSISDLIVPSKAIFSIICGIVLWRIMKIGWYLAFSLCVIGIITNIYWIISFEYIQDLMPFIISILFNGSIIYFLIIEEHRDLFGVEKENVYKYVMALIGLIALFNFVHTYTSINN